MMGNTKRAPAAWQKELHKRAEESGSSEIVMTVKWHDKPLNLDKGSLREYGLLQCQVDAFSRVFPHYAISDPPWHIIGCNYSNLDFPFYDQPPSHLFPHVHSWRQRFKRWMFGDKDHESAHRELCENDPVLFVFWAHLLDTRFSMLNIAASNDVEFPLGPSTKTGKVREAGEIRSRVDCLLKRWDSPGAPNLSSLRDKALRQLDKGHIRYHAYDDFHHHAMEMQFEYDKVLVKGERFALWMRNGLWMWESDNEATAMLRDSTKINDIHDWFFISADGVRDWLDDDRVGAYVSVNVLAGRYEIARSYERPLGAGDDITKQQCDAARNAAHICLGVILDAADLFSEADKDSDVFWGMSEPSEPASESDTDEDEDGTADLIEDWDFFTECVQNLVNQSREAQSLYFKSWSRPLNDFFAIHRPDTSRRFSWWTHDEYLTAYEFVCKTMEFACDTLESHFLNKESSRKYLGDFVGSFHDQIFNLRNSVSAADIDAEWVEAMKVLSSGHARNGHAPERIESQVRALPSPEKPAVTTDPPQIILDGTPIALEPDVAVWLKDVIELGRISTPEFRRRHDGFKNFRPDKANIPSTVKKHIQSETGKGFWWE